MNINEMEPINTCQIAEQQLDGKSENGSLPIGPRTTLSNCPSQDNTADTNRKKVFRKKSGTTDKGKDYENHVVASLILKMIADDEIKNFSMSSNDETFGDFDDVVFEIEKAGEPEEKYAVQLKHTNETRKLSLSSLVAGKGNFSLQKYFKSFQELGNSVTGYKLILMTNLKFDISKCAEIGFKADNVSFKIELIKCAANPLLNTSKTTSHCYKFRIREDMGNATEASKLHEYKTFFDQFFLYSNQSNCDQLEREISVQLKRLFSDEAIDLKSVEDRYLKFISKWSLSEGMKHKLYKKMMQRIIALYLATPFIHPICFGPVTENAKILQQAISNFDITVFDEKSTENVRKIWGNLKNSLGDISEVNKKRKKYQITLENIDDISTLSERECTEILWTTNKCPLILSGSASVYEAINLCRDRKFVLIGADPINESLKKYSVFHKFSDLKDQKEVLRDLSTRFRCSLPGQEVNLEYLLQKSDEFYGAITTNELVEMVDHSYKIMVEKEELPEHYISRQLSTNVIDFKYLNTADTESVIVISNVRTEQDFNNLKNFNITDIDDYLKANPESNKKLTTQDQKQDAYKNLSQRGNLYIKKGACSQEEILKLCEWNGKKGKYHHFKICEGMLEWVKSSSDVSQLKQHRIEGHFLEESELGTACSQNKIQLIADDPGMGKSLLMKSLKSKFLGEMLTILLSPADMLEICNFLQKVDSHDIENFIIDLKYSNYNKLRKSVLKLLMIKGQVVYLWDALDEISFDENMNVITKLIVKISGNNSRHWLTCRRNLKIFLESKLNVLSTTIVQFSEEQQTYYIQERLQCVCSTEDINEMVKRIKNNVSFVNYRDILSIPLQIYMLTELCLQNIEKYSVLIREIFSLADLYQYFIQEKFNAYYKDKINVDESTARKLKQTQNVYINQYEKAALNMILESEDLKELNTDCGDFLMDTKQQGDCFGFVTAVEENTDNVEPQFPHISYAEYFVATYFSKRKVSKLSDFLFKEKYSNVRFFFDMLLAENSPAHIAVLYKNLPEIKKCGDDIVRKDCGGRSILHIACSWGERYPLLTFERHGKVFLLNDEISYVKEENLEYRQMLEYLLTVCNDIDEPDNIFNMSSLSYARKCNCLFAIATIAPQLKIGCFSSDDENFNCRILLYSVISGVDSIIDLFENIKPIETKGGNTLLHLASKNGHEKVVNLLIKSGMNISAADKTGRTALHWASDNGHDKVAALLIEFGANINRANVWGSTPLHEACFHKSYKVMRVLIKSGADIDAGDQYGETPLHKACRLRSYEVMKVLIKSGADIDAGDQYGETPLHKACRLRSYEVMKVLIKSGADVDAGDKYGETSLHKASRNGQDKVAAFLIEFGANVHAVGVSGETPLHEACANGSYEVMRVLIKSGADIDAKDRNGCTPLNMALISRYDKAAALLIELGANVNSANDSCDTPLHIACDHESYELIKVLIKSGADIDARNKNGTTSLHIASVRGKDKVAASLIEFGANINTVDDSGNTPLHTACGLGFHEITKLLIKSKADINAADKDGRTPLHFASYFGHDKVAALLIEFGADVKATTDAGSTPFDLASKKGHDKIVRLLLKSELYVYEKGDTPLTPRKTCDIL